LTSPVTRERVPLTEATAPPPLIPRKTVLVVGLSLEGALLFAALIWAWWREIAWDFTFQTGHVLPLIASLLLLALINLICFSPSPKWKWKEEFSQFLELFVLPLARDLGPGSALLLAVASGIAEELFFRGVLIEELTSLTGSMLAGQLAAALIFSVVHFGPSTSRFPKVVLVYWLAGLVLGISYSLSGTLAVPILAHAIYNFCAFAILTKGFRMTGHDLVHPNLPKASKSDG